MQHPKNERPQRPVLRRPDGRALKPGELTIIIIGTVVNSDEGIDARELAERLNQWGIQLSQHDAAVRLADLAKAGRIERLSRGLYGGY